MERKKDQKKGWLSNISLSFTKSVPSQNIGAIPKKQDLQIASLIFIFFLIAYLLTLYPDLGGRYNFGDSAKFQYLGLTWYPPHPTGYPLYMLVNKAVSHLPLPVSQAIKINALSAIFGALTSATVFLLALAVSGGRLASIFSSAMFSFSSMVWITSTEAEIISLNSLFVATSILLMVYWSFSFSVSRNSVELSSGAGLPSLLHTKMGSKSFLYAGLAVYIMGFSNHATMITMLPAFLFIIWIHEKRNMVRSPLILWCFVWGVVVLSLYGVYFVKIPRMLDHPLDAMEPIVWSWDAWIINHFLGADFRQYMFAFTLKNLLVDRIPMFLKITQRELGWLIVFIGLTGMIVFTRKNFLVGIFLILCAAGQIFWALNYNINDIVPYFIPAFLVSCVLCAYSIQMFIDFSQRAFWRYGKHIKVIIFLFFLCLLLIHARESYKALVKNTREGIALTQYVRDLSRIIPKHAAIERGPNYYVAEGLQYLRYVEQDRRSPDFIIIDPFYIPYAKCTVYSYERHTDPVIAQYLEYEEIATSLAHWLSQWGPSHIMIISIKDEGTRALDEETISALQRFGLQADLKGKYRWSYIAVAHLGKGCKEILEPRKIRLTVKSGSMIEGTNIIAKKKLRVISGGFETGNLSQIYVGSRNLSYDQRGMNIVILNESDFSLVDRVNADTYVETKVKKLYRVKLKQSPSHLIQVGK